MSCNCMLTICLLSPGSRGLPPTLAKGGFPQRGPQDLNILRCVAGGETGALTLRPSTGFPSMIKKKRLVMTVVLTILVLLAVCSPPFWLDSVLP